MPYREELSGGVINANTYIHVRMGAKGWAFKTELWRLRLGGGKGQHQGLKDHRTEGRGGGFSLSRGVPREGYEIRNESERRPQGGRKSRVAENQRKRRVWFSNKRPKKRGEPGSGVRRGSVRTNEKDSGSGGSKKLVISIRRCKVCFQGVQKVMGREIRKKKGGL